MDTNHQKKVCATCRNVSGGHMACNGCGQSFCWEHITGHRQDIEKQMDALRQNQDLFKTDRHESSHQNQLVQEIDRWEKQSIEEIKIAADAIRAELESLIQKSKENYKISIKKISEDIDKSRQLNQFSEIDIHQWTAQLEDIQSQAQISFGIQIRKDEATSFITKIKINENTKRRPDQDEPAVKRSRSEANNNLSNHNERFDRVLGKALFQEQNRLAMNGIDSRSFISGANLYSTGKHYLHFRIEEVQITGQCCFFGMMTSTECMKESFYQMKSVYGIWCSGCIVNGSRPSKTTRGNKNWYKGDTVTLVFDCDKQQIHFENKRINWCQELHIDLNVCPLPWKFLTIIRGHQIRIV